MIFLFNRLSVYGYGVSRVWLGLALRLGLIFSCAAEKCVAAVPKVHSDDCRSGIAAKRIKPTTIRHLKHGDRKCEIVFDLAEYDCCEDAVVALIYYFVYCNTNLSNSCHKPTKTLFFLPRKGTFPGSQLYVVAKLFHVG